MEIAIQHIVNALSLGSLYAVIALGIALIFGIMRLVNFAHGELIMLGGYSLLLVSDVPWPVAVLACLIVATVAALLMERLALRPVRGASPTTLLITSFALAFLLQSVMLFIMGGRARAVALPRFVTEAFVIGDVRIQKLYVVTIGLTTVLLIGLAAFLSRTTLGLQMRAAAEDFVMARLLRIHANRVIAGAFGLSGLLAGFVAVLYVGQTGSVTPAMGLTPLIVGIVATVIGGMSSLWGAVAGGYVLGALTVGLQVGLPADLRPFRDAFVFSAVIILLLLRPHGLFVRRETVSTRT